MALRDFRGKTGKSTTETAAAAKPRTETYIDGGCELIGELRFPGTVRIDGRVEGEIRAARVIVGESARIEADISAEAVEIHGTVRGDIRVEHKTTLHATARVTGEIQTSGIVVEEGARFQGSIVIGGDEAQPAKEGAAAGVSKPAKKASADGAAKPEELAA